MIQHIIALDSDLLCTRTLLRQHVHMASPSIPFNSIAAFSGVMASARIMAQSEMLFSHKGHAVVESIETAPVLQTSAFTDGFWDETCDIPRLVADCTHLGTVVLCSKKVSKDDTYLAQSYAA